ncbi:hypothetical protein N9F33_03380, partial [Pseudomonadales bacterium]|nr:hypothetical protein [Pseudomonadales bacterium]
SPAVVQTLVWVSLCITGLNAALEASLALITAQRVSAATSHLNWRLNSPLSLYRTLQQGQY